MIGKVLFAGALVVVVAVAVPAAWIGIPWVTHDATIPPSCQEPAEVDYSNVGRADYGPYSVKFTSWRTITDGTSSSAVVGHHQDVEAKVDDGVHVEIESTDIDAFRCEWTVEGVTIIEPPLSGTLPGNEHFIPAMRFLGGR